MLETKSLYASKKTFTCLIFSAFNSGLKFCGNSCGHRGSLMGLSPFPVPCPHNFTACCQGLWGRSCKKLILLWERLKAETSARDPEAAAPLPFHQAEQQPVCTASRALASLLPSRRSPAVTRSRGVPAPLPPPPGRAAAPAAGRAPRVSTDGAARFALMHLFYFCHLMASRVTPGRHLSVRPTLTS